MQADAKLSKFMFHLKFSNSADYLHEHELYEVMRSRNLYQLQFGVRSNFNKRMRNIAISQKAHNYGFVNSRKLFVRRMRERREHVDKLRELTAALKTKLKMSSHDDVDVVKFQRRYVPLPGSDEMYMEFPDIIQKFDSPKNKRGSGDDDEANSSGLPVITTPSMTGTIFEPEPRRRYSMQPLSSLSPTFGLRDRRHSSQTTSTFGKSSAKSASNGNFLAPPLDFFDEAEEIEHLCDTNGDTERNVSRNSHFPVTGKESATSEHTTETPNTNDKVNPTVDAALASNGSESNSEEEDVVNRKMSSASTSLPYVQTPSMIATPIHMSSYTSGKKRRRGHFSKKSKTSGGNRFLKTPRHQHGLSIDKAFSDRDTEKNFDSKHQMGENNQIDSVDICRKWNDNERADGVADDLVNEVNADDGISLDSLKKSLPVANKTPSTKCVEWTERYGLTQALSSKSTIDKFSRLFIDRPSKFTFSYVHAIKQHPGNIDTQYQLFQKTNQGSKKRIRNLDKLSEQLKLKADSTLSLPDLNTAPKAMVTLDPGGTTPDGRLVLTNADYQEYLAGYRKAREIRLNRAKRQNQTLRKMVEEFAKDPGLRNSDDSTESYPTIKTV